MIPSSSVCFGFVLGLFLRRPRHPVVLSVVCCVMSACITSTHHTTNNWHYKSIAESPKKHAQNKPKIILSVAASPCLHTKRICCSHPLYERVLLLTPLSLYLVWSHTLFWSVLESIWESSIDSACIQNPIFSCDSIFILHQILQSTFPP